MKKILILVFSIAVSFILIQSFSSSLVKAEDEVVSNGNETYAPLPNTSSQSIQIVGYSTFNSSGLRSSQTLLVFPKGFASNAKFKYKYTSTTTNTPFDIVNANGSSDVAVRLHAKLKDHIPLLQERPLLPTSGVSVGEAIANGLANVGIAVYNTTVVAPSNILIRATNLAIDADNAITTATNSLYRESYETYSPIFRTYKKDAYPYGIVITVKDVNPISTTYNKSVTITLNNLAQSNFKSDAVTPYGLFLGESQNLASLMEEMGVAHIYNCPGSSATVISTLDSKITHSGNTLNPINLGLESFVFSASKSNCKFHGSQSTGNVSAMAYVFKRPDLTVKPGTIFVSNTQKDVVYSIGERKVRCSYDGEVIVFNKLADNYTYDLVLSADTGYGTTANKRIKVRTPNPYYGYLHYEYVQGSEIIDRLTAYNHGEAISAPNGPFAPGFVLENWYDDPAFNTVHDFKQAVTSDFHLYGKWDALRSSLNLTVNVNGSLLSGEKVELYQNGEKVVELKEGSKGVYSIKDTIVNGTYNLYINGKDTKVLVNPFTYKTARNVTAEQLKNRLSGDTLNITVNLNKLSVYTYVDGVNQEIVDAKIEFKELSRLNSTFFKDGAYNSYFSSADPTVYDVYLNGSNANPNLKLSKNNKTGRLDFNSIKVTINTDDPDWISNNICLRKDDGQFVATLRAGTYDPVSQSIVYTAMLLDDTSASPTKYYIYADGLNTGVYVTSTLEGKTASLTFDTVTLTLTKDSNPYTDAVIRFANDKHTYSVTKNTNGVYKTHLFRDGENYSYEVVGTIDSHSYVVDQKPYTNSLNYFTQVFMTSSKEGETITYNETLFRRYIVLSGEIINSPTGAYFPELAFDCFNETPYAQGETKQTSYDFTQPVTATHTFYAHFRQAEININGFVRCADDGKTQIGSGNSFIMPNLTITGFDEGNVIQGVKAEFTNVTKVKMPKEDGVSFIAINDIEEQNDEEYQTFTAEDLEYPIAIVFDEKIPALEVANYLRRIIVTPKQDADAQCEVTFTASDAPISIYGPADWTYTKEKAEGTYETLTGSTTGKTLNTGNYYVANDATFTNANGNGLTINGDVKIYIPEGVTLTAKGSNATAYNNPGKAGILLPSGKTLTVYGTGTLSATGGNASNGSNGGGGGGAGVSASDYYTDGAFKKRKLTISGCQGGAGGVGGAGAGAGIGTDGGSGGAGGSRPSQTSATIVFYSANDGYKEGASGNVGGAGSNALQTGDFSSNQYITLDLKGGTSGTSGGSGASAGSSASGDIMSANAFAQKDKVTFTYKVTGGAGGGGGGAGWEAVGIGTGGTGGGGGGSGASGGATIAWSGATDWYAKKAFQANGGGYGTGAKNGTNGGKNGGDSYAKAGGTGGSSTNKSTAKQYTTLTTQPSFTLTFDASKFKGDKTVTTYYLPDKGQTEVTTVTVPNILDIDGLIFKGWVVTSYGVAGDGLTTHAFVESDTTKYQPTSYTSTTIPLDKSITGNIVLKPVFEEMVAKKAIGSISVSGDTFKPSTPAITYYNYKVNTTLDGETEEYIKDVGNISLKNGTTIYPLASDGSGKYSFTSSEDTTFNILYNGVDSGLTVTKGETKFVNLKSFNISLNLDGERASLFNSVKLVSNDSTNKGTIDMNQKYEGGPVAGEFNVIYLANKLSDSYRVYVDDVDSYVDIAPGESKEINYRKAIVTLAGNVSPTTAILKKGSKELPMNFDGANRRLSYIYLEGDDEYKVIINELDTGKTISFNSEGQTTTVELNECVAKIYKDGSLVSDETYTPSIDGSKMEKISVGTYKRTVIGPLTNIVVKGKVIPVSNPSVNVNIYSVVYDLDGGVGTKPNDSLEYFEGDDATISSLNNFMTSDGKGFVGWTFDGTTYLAGETIKNINKKVNLIAKYRSSTDYDILLTIDGVNHYINADEINLYLKDRQENQTITLTVLKGCSLPALDLKENDNLIINQNIVVTIDSLTTYGNATIGSGSTVNITGDVNNKVSKDKTKQFVVEENARLNVGKDFNNEKQLTNYGTIDISKGKLTNGSLTGGNVDERAIIDNYGEIIVKKFENNGYFNNKKVLTIDSTSDMEDVVNNGILTNNGGKIYGTDDSLPHPQHTMMNNNTILNDNGEIYINIYNKKTISGGEVVSPNRIILPDAPQDAYGNFYIKPNGGTVTYDTGKVSVTTDNPEQHVVTYQIAGGFDLLDTTKITKIEKNGFEFDGWYENSDFSGDKATGIEKNDGTSNRAFYAKWRLAANDKSLAGQFESTEGGYTGKASAFSQVSTNANAAASGLDTVTQQIFYQSLNEIKATVDEGAHTVKYPQFVLKLIVNNVEYSGTKGQEAINKLVDTKEGETPSFMTISLNKCIGDDGSQIKETSITSIEKQGIIEVIVPYNVNDGVNPTKQITGVVRYHGSTATKLDNNNSHTDGTYYIEDVDANTKNVHIFTNKFSDYAILYKNSTATINAYDYVYTYDGTGHLAPAGVDYDGTGKPTITYSVDQGTYSTTIPSLTEAGKIDITAKASLDASDADLATKDYTLEVKKRQLRYATFPEAKPNLVYNGQDQEVLSSGSIETDSTLGTCNAHIEYKLEGGTYSEYIPQVKNAGTYRVYYKIVTDSLNHTGGEEQYVDVTVAKKPLTVDSIQATTKEYDGKLDATLNCTISGVVGTDDVSIQAKGNYDTKDVGTSKSITVTSYTLSGDNSSNYKAPEVTAMPASGDITARSTTVTIAPNGGYYGSKINPATVKLDRAVDDASATLTYAGKAYDGTEYSGTVVPSQAGIYTVTASITDPNYVLDDVTKPATSEFVVRKKIIETPHIPSVYYDGGYHKPDIKDLAGVYTVIKNDGGTGIGSYPVILQLEDNDNNRWSNVSSSILDKDTVALTTLEFRIVKKPEPKDESCEKVIGPYWHWNNDKGICEEIYVVGTSTR